MSLITTNKNALKLLRIDGTTVNSNSLSIHDLDEDENLNLQIKTSNKSMSNKPKPNPKKIKSNKAKTTTNIDVIINSKSTKKPNSNFDFDSTKLQDTNDEDNRRISDFIRKIAERESTPEYSSDSDEDDELFLDDEDKVVNDIENGNQSNKNKKLDVMDGIELMIFQLQKEAKSIEQKRYLRHTNRNSNTLISNSVPKDIVNLTQKRGNYKINQKEGIQNMNWWDLPFRDHLRSAKRPIIRETGIDQFASEYMLSLLRDKEQKVLKLRQEVEYKRTRPPADNWYEMKDQNFGNELRRHVRQKL